MVVFSTDSRPVKRRKAQIDRHFERRSQQQVRRLADCWHAGSADHMHFIATYLHAAR